MHQYKARHIFVFVDFGINLSACHSFSIVNSDIDLFARMPLFLFHKPLRSVVMQGEWGSQIKKVEPGLVENKNKRTVVLVNGVAVPFGTHEN